jgi:hypothetical protein
MSIEYGFLYAIFKDFYNFIKRVLKSKKVVDYKVEDKQINNAWLENSGFKADLEKKGYTLYWSTASKIEEHKLEGYEIIYETDNEKKVKYKLINKDTILMGKIKPIQPSAIE